jgi:hypothetical protein
MNDLEHGRDQLPVSGEAVSGPERAKGIVFQSGSGWKKAAPAAEPTRSHPTRIYAQSTLRDTHGLERS